MRVHLYAACLPPARGGRYAFSWGLGEGAAYGKRLCRIFIREFCIYLPDDCLLGQMLLNARPVGRMGIETLQPVLHMQ